MQYSKYITVIKVEFTDEIDMPVAIFRWPSLHLQGQVFLDSTHIC